MEKHLFCATALAFFACGKDQGPVAGEEKINFDANPNSHNYFETKFMALVGFLKRSLDKNSHIGPEDIRHCLRYVLQFKDFENFFKKSQTDALLHGPFDDFINIVFSFYGDILGEEMERFGANETLEQIGEELCLSRINKLIEIETEETEEEKEKEEKEEEKEKKGNEKESVVKMLKDFISEQLAYLMAQRPDIVFPYAVALVLDLTLSEILVEKETLIDLYNTDNGENFKILNSIFTAELEQEATFKFSTQDKDRKKKSQYQVLIDKFKPFFNKKYPCISFERHIREFLNEKNTEIKKALHKHIADFFKKHFQNYRIKFTAFSLHFLTEFLSKIDKETFSATFVEYLLTFKSDAPLQNYLPQNMGHSMLRYEPLEQNEFKDFNAQIDKLLEFLKDFTMNEKTFSDITGKQIKDGEKHLMLALTRELETAKML